VLQAGMFSKKAGSRFSEDAKTEQHGFINLRKWSVA
jgi:hypothetical protein